MEQISYKKLNFKKILSFINSKKNVLKISYNGKNLNPIFGITKHFKKHFKFTDIPILLKIYFQQRLFPIIENLEGSTFKNSIYRFFGMKIGKEVYIAPGVYIDRLFPELIRIEDGCIIGYQSTLLTHEIAIDYARLGKVHIKKQALIGAESIIRSGTTIGTKSIVGMRSLVIKNIPDNKTYVGFPAKELNKSKHKK